MKVFLILLASLALSENSFSAPSGKQACYQYNGGPFLVFEDIELKDHVSVGFSGSGVDPYAYEYLKVENRINTGCDVCFEISSQYVDPDGKKIDVKILTVESKGSAAFNAEVRSKKAGSNRWSIWHSNLRCIDWSK